MVYPNNVLHMATESSNKRHSAAFPIALPTWFIKIFTQPGDITLDPFVGSGTTAAVLLGRRYVGIDTKEEYVRLTEDGLSKVQPRMPDVAERNAAYSIASCD